MAPPAPARRGSRRSLTTGAAAAAAVVALLAPPLGPSAAADDPDLSSGAITVGYRTVDARGTAARYRQDVDLSDGFRLFGLSLRWTPSAGRRARVDLVELDASHLGGDPDEAVHLAVRRRGVYRLRLDRTRSRTYYQDLLAPVERADPAPYSGGDPHTLDFDRVRDAARLDLDLTSRAKGHFAFERSTRLGASTTTLALQGDLFRLERPIDDAMRAWRGGLEYSWKRVTLAVEEEVRRTSDASTAFLADPSVGEEAGDATVLDLYRRERPTTAKSRRHTVRLVARPHPRFTARLAGSIQDLDLEFTAAERQRGTGSDGRPFAVDAAGGGAIFRDVDLVDLDLSFRISGRVTLVGAVSAKNLDQDGSAYVAGGAYPYPYAAGRWRIETRSGEVGLRIDVSPRLTVGGGLRGEQREVSWSTGQRPAPAGDTTRHTGLVADLGWRPASGLRLSATVETDAYDDPFSPTAPGRRARARVRVRHRLAGGLSLAAHLSSDRSRNRDSGWDASSLQAGLQLAFERPGLVASVGGGAISLDREIVRAGGGGAAALFDRADARFLDGRIAYTFAERWTVGGTVRTYDNRGTFAVRRGDASGFLEVALERGLSARVGYRAIDYEEAGAALVDYRADVAELTMAWRW